MKYTYDESQKAIKKLEAQVDFLNTENKKLNSEVEIFKTDETGNVAVK